MVSIVIVIYPDPVTNDVTSTKPPTLVSEGVLANFDSLDNVFGSHGSVSVFCVGINFRFFGRCL